MASLTLATSSEGSKNDKMTELTTAEPIIVTGSTVTLCPSGRASLTLPGRSDASVVGASSWSSIVRFCRMGFMYLVRELEAKRMSLYGAIGRCSSRS